MTRQKVRHKRIVISRDRGIRKITFIAIIAKNVCNSMLHCSHLISMAAILHGSAIGYPPRGAIRGGISPNRGVVRNLKAM